MSEQTTIFEKIIRGIKRNTRKKVEEKKNKLDLNQRKSKDFVNKHNIEKKMYEIGSI